MSFLLFPGRHHLLTNFQFDYLSRVVAADVRDLKDIDGQPLRVPDNFRAIIWPITSANHSNTRRNPLPADRREVAIEDFGRDLSVQSFVYLIDDVGTTTRFADYVLKKIEVESQGRFQLTPVNTVVACSTPEVIAMYERLGFQILSVELLDRHTAKMAAATPWQLVTQLVEEGKDALLDGGVLRNEVAPASRRLYEKYGFADLIVDLHASPLLTDDGDITKTRDYNTYARAFDAGADRKCGLIHDFVVPGRIVDIGCCTGALIGALAREDRLRESDFYGIEVARPLYIECLHRKEQGAFSNDHVFFYQRDFAAGPTFSENSINTAITASLTHEIESYLGRDALRRFIALVFSQLSHGGRWINLDVVGPENKDDEVYLLLDRDDGLNDGLNDDLQRQLDSTDREACRAYLQGLSTFARFVRFSGDFRKGDGNPVGYSLIRIGGREYIRLRLQDACEYLSKKDYTDNWHSEMHETFCFWSLSQWAAAAKDSGFQVAASSRAFANPWLIENRYRGKAELFQMVNGELLRMEYPVTNMLLIADKQ